MISWNVLGQYEGGAKSNSESLSEGCGQTTEICIEALGGTTTTTTSINGDTSLEGISGLDTLQAGSAKSESFEKRTN